MSDHDLVALLTGAEVDYMKASNGRTRHFRINAIEKVWVAKSNGKRCIKCDTDTLHGSKVLSDDHCEHRVLHVDGLAIRSC